MPGIWALTLPFAAFAPAWARTTDGVELSGATAKLFKAVEVNDMPGVKAALAAGADINAKNAAGKTAADLAVDRGHFIIAHFLLSQRSPGVRAPRTAEPKSAPTPRRLTPKPATTSKPAAKSRKTVAQPLQPKRKFIAPPPKPPADMSPETDDLPAPETMAKPVAKAATQPRRALTPPPLPASKRAASRPAGRRFQLPPQKPAQPLPDAVAIAKAPGMTAPAPTAASEMKPGQPVGDLPTDDLLAPPLDGPVGDLPPDDSALPGEDGIPVAALTDEEQLLPDASPDADTATEPAPSAATMPRRRAADLGPVGQFFQNLLDLVQPDQASGQAAGKVARAPAASGTAKPGTPNAASGATPSRAPGSAPGSALGPAPATTEDARLAAELERDLGILNEEAKPAGEDDIVELKELDAPESAPIVRRVETPPPAVRRSVPAPKVAPDPLQAPAESSTARTLDRLEGLVGDKPKEDEFGLPEVEITGTPEEDLPSVDVVQTKDEGEPSLESLIGDDTPPAAQPSDELPPTEVQETAPAQMQRAQRQPNIDDAPGPESRDPLMVDDGPLHPRAAPAGSPRSFPAQPVESAATSDSRSRQRPRFMTTTERLRRLNEALSREVPLDTPTRISQPNLGNRGTDFMITGVQPSARPARGKLPPSMLPTRPLSQRPTPSDRFIDRLERIRRNTYEEETPAAPVRPDVPVQQTTRPMAQPAPARPAAPIPAAPQQQAAAPPAKDDASPLSKLVQFFKQADSRSAVAGTEGRPGRGHADAEATERAELARQADYRNRPNQGPPKEALATPEPLTEQARKSTSDAAAASAVGEPPPGQTVGKMTPGFMENLSRLFTDSKVAEKGWAAEVEMLEPESARQAPSGPVLRPVSPSGAASGRPSGAARETAQRQQPASPVEPPPLPAEEAPLPPPSGDLPADAGAAWTTTVEMATDTGDPMVLGVLKTPVPNPVAPQTARRGAPAPGILDAPAETEVAVAPPPATNRAPTGDLPPAEGETIDIVDDGLPPAEGEAIVINDDGLPPARGDDFPPALSDDLPPAQGDDLPPAEGEIQAAQPKPRAAPQRAAQPPYSDPLQRPMPTPAAPDPGPPPLSRTAELKPGPDARTRVAGDTRLRRDERLAAAGGEAPPGQTPGSAPQAWRVTKLAKNTDPPPTRKRQRPAMLSRTSLAGVNLALGESVSLESTLPPEGGIDEGNRCVKKNRGTTLFCIEPVDWPVELKPKFVVPTILYTGPMAIVRYDQGSASRLHALFPSIEFETVAAFYRKRYGPPTEIWKRSIAPLAQPRRDNPTLAWRNRDPKTNAVTILELRQFDDTRGGFPDTERGAVMLYLANSPSIFPQVSSHELMRLKREAAKKSRES